MVSLLNKKKNTITVYSDRQAVLQDKFTVLVRRADSLDKHDKQRVQWLLSDLQFEINSAGVLVKQLHDNSGVTKNTDEYASRVNSNMDILEQELQKTNVLIEKVENVLIELINAELDIHEERLKYYRVQSHLAKARILDRSLAELDDPLSDNHHNDSSSINSTRTLNQKSNDVQGDDNAP